jgi:hypothetical protein
MMVATRMVGVTTLATIMVGVTTLATTMVGVTTLATTTMVGVMTLVVQESLLKKITHAAAASNPVTNVPSLEMIAVSIVASQVISLATARNQRNLVEVIVLAGNAMKLVTLLAIAPHQVEEEETGHVTNAARLATLLAIAPQAEETWHVANVVRMVILQRSARLLALVPQLVVAAVA